MFDSEKISPSERKIVWKGIVNGEELTGTFGERGLCVYQSDHRLKPVPGNGHDSTLRCRDRRHWFYYHRRQWARTPDHRTPRSGVREGEPWKCRGDPVGAGFRPD